MADCDGGHKAGVRGACECVGGGLAVTAAERFVRLHKATVATAAVVAGGATPHGPPHRQLVKVEEGTRGASSSSSCYADVYTWEGRLRTPGLPSALPEYEEPPQQAPASSSSCRLEQPPSLLPSSPHVRSLCSTPEIRHRAGRLCGGASGVLETPGHVASQAREPSAEPPQGTFVVSLEEIHEARRRMHLRRLLCSSYEPAAACELRNGLVATGILREPGLEEYEGEKEEGDEVEEEDSSSGWAMRTKWTVCFLKTATRFAVLAPWLHRAGRGLCRDSGIGSCGPDFGSGGAEGAAICSGNPALEIGGDDNGGARLAGRRRGGGGGGDENGSELEVEEEVAWILSRPIGAGDGGIGRESAFKRSGGGGGCYFEGGAGAGAGCRACAGHAAPLYGSPGKVHLNGCASGGGGSVVEADLAVLRGDAGSPGRAAVERRERKGLLCRLQRKTRTSSFNGFDLPSRQGALGLDEKPSLPVKHEEDADPCGESPYRRASAPDSFLGKKVKSVRDTVKKTMTKLAKANCEERESDFDVALRCTRLSLEEEQLVEEKQPGNSQNNGHHHHQQQQQQWQLAELGGEAHEEAGERQENFASCLNGARLREFHRCAARAPPSSSCRRAPEVGVAGGSCGTGERLAATGVSRSPGGIAAVPAVAPLSPRDQRKAGAHATEVRAIVHRENHATEPPPAPGLAADTGAGAELASGPAADGDRSAVAAAAVGDAESKGSSRRKKTKPKTVFELLERIHLQDYAGLLTRSGYEDLETLGLLDAEDLDEMGVLDHEHRAKLLTAAALLRADDRENHGRQRNASFDQDAAHHGTSAFCGDAAGLAAAVRHRSPGRSAEDPRRRAAVRCFSAGSRRAPAPAAAWGCVGVETRGPARRSWSLDDVRKIEHLLEFGRWQRRLAHRGDSGRWWSPGHHHHRHHRHHRHRRRRDEQQDLGACGEDVAARQTTAAAAAIEPADAVMSAAEAPGAASSDGPGAKAVEAVGAVGVVDPAGGDPNGEAVAEPPAAGAAVS
ncbi:uncharacterized protein LOC133357030 [Lethenteron reissneri]|uniref:uncharacterized protein LOC133357030 n=1 Tax=Lethenteron reissneri TaxID=7753 RepID=UPI002AB6FC2D|nr:uncharacterized protein LOC133357030 [Lethenteron reissneri]